MMSAATINWPSNERVSPLRVAALSGTMAVNLALLAALMLPMSSGPIDTPREPPTLDMTWVESEPMRPIPPVPQPPVIKPQPVRAPVKSPPKPTPVENVDTTPVTTVPATLPPATLPNVPTDPGPTVDTTPIGNATLGFVSRTIPNYPMASIRKHREGVVTLRILVDESGRPERVEIHDSSGFPELDQSARKEALRWRFTPATREGTPVKAWGLVPVEFRIPRG